jgi:AcrR family transcriptional regulator
MRHRIIMPTKPTKKPEQTFESIPNGSVDPKPAPNRQNFDEKQRHILGAATGLFSRVGYEKATMRSVAQAADVSLAGLYHYFDCKETMLFRIQFRTFTSLLGVLKENLHGVDDPDEQLRVLVKTHVGYFAANMDALKVCSHELESLGESSHEEIRRLRHDYYRLTRSVIDRLIESQSNGVSLDRYVATMSLFGMLNWLYRWYDPQRDRSPALVAGQLANQFLHGLRGQADGPAGRTGGGTARS